MLNVGEWRFDGDDYYKLLEVDPNANDVQGHPVQFKNKTGTWFYREWQMDQHLLITDEILIQKIESDGCEVNHV
ncbi:hypothetical protein LCM23_12900 [Cytobacillus kochii]|uniref:hypothetical protein n=1 Tax=Cytobacillus kochii TaxID=859143 RepID=UPI001CD39467|nr:hypothetical protein [Cytobacillus kochii]MCA1026992.1 hypothetical protein [Cytobacillus kochii]